jgi:hypothetical protein
LKQTDHSSFLYGSETWTGEGIDKFRVTAAEIKFMTWTATYTYRDKLPKLRMVYRPLEKRKK